jgi:hypothetical protein
LVDEQKAVRVQACQELIHSVDDNRSLLDSFVIGDETGVSIVIPPPKRQSMEWHKKKFSKVKKTK